MIRAVGDHLWQSTIFCVVVALLMLILQRNRAAVRHGLWLAASMKFLIPFSLLVSISSHIEWRRAPAPVQPRVSILEQISQPFGSPDRAPLLVSSRSAPSRLPGILFGLWLCGFGVQVLAWWQRWRSVRAALRVASPMNLGLPIRTVSTPSQLEPGVFGIFRPVLVLPEGIAEHLTADQFELVVAHELCHVRRRDNLAAAVHMVVEALFWFHPLVWWIRVRLVEERERAFDEEVLRAAVDPQDYAEGIVAVCRCYLKSPLVCLSGVTGSNLKRRIEAIMSNRCAIRLNFAKRLTLSAVGAAALVVPLMVGMLHAPAIGAQSSAPSTPKFEVASVKPANPGSQGMILSGDPSRFTIHNVTIRFLISLAYNVKDFQISGGPGLLDSERYDIEATYGENRPTRSRLNFVTIQADPQVRLMLQALLSDRFHLAIRHETKDLPAYSLNVAKNGPKLKESTTPEDLQNMRVDLGQIKSNRMSTAELAGMLSRVLGLPVVDKTGLTGYYDLLLNWTPDQSSADRGPSIFTAIQDSLGLRLVAGKEPVDVLVIDHVERPTKN